MRQETLNGNSKEVLNHKHRYAILKDAHEKGYFKAVCVCCGFYTLDKQRYYMQRQSQATIKQIWKSKFRKLCHINKEEIEKVRSVKNARKRSSDGRFQRVLDY